MARLPGFVGPSYTSQSIVAADDQCINLIPAKIESGTGAAPWVFDPAPGFHALSVSASGIARAVYTLNDAAYIVVGSGVIIVTGTPSSVSATPLFSMGSSTGPASIVSSGFASNEVLFTNGDGSEVWWYNTVAITFGQIVTVSGQTVAFLNGFFLLLDRTTSTIFFSAPLDATSWDPLDFVQRNDLGDIWQTMIVKQNELWLFGSSSTSVYFPVDADPPFQPNLNVTVTRGINAIASLCLLEGSPIWFADDLTVRYANGYSPVRVSNHAVEYAWSQYTVTRDADAFTYYEQGHFFYVLNFPTANATWVYDVTTGMWSQRGPYVAMSDSFSVLAANYGFQIPESTDTVNWPTIVLGRASGQLYVYSQTYATEIDGTTGITRRRRAPVLVNELKNISHYMFQLMLEVGTANAAPPGDAPTILLQYSDNGGQTFNTGESMSAGAHNEFDKRVIWRKLGIARNRVYQVTMDAPIQWRLVDAYINQSLGAS